jgi:hypothetical protein
MQAMAPESSIAFVWDLLLAGEQFQIDRENKVFFPDERSAVQMPSLLRCMELQIYVELPIAAADVPEIIVKQEHMLS